LVSTSEDITEWQQAAGAISHMAHHDALTGLPNRTQLVEKLKNALAVLPLRGGSIAVHFIDLDRFKNVNDTLGTITVISCSRPSRTPARGDPRRRYVARLGGDEFVVVQTDVKGKGQAEDFARRMASAATAPMKLSERAIAATISVGVALAPVDGTNPERLLKCADLALYKAKADGRNCVRFFRAEMDTDLQAALQTRDDDPRCSAA